MSNGPWTRTDSMVLQILANTLANQNREQSAADLLEYVLTHEPDNADVVRALCGIYLLLERNEEALAAIKRYEGLVPSASRTNEILMVKSQALWELGRTEEATTAMNDYLARKAS